MERKKGEGEETMMKKQFSVETAVCTEQQRLFEESQRALEIWNGRRAGFCQSHLSGRDAGDELLRLQAKYARAYAVLQRHTHNCLMCQLMQGAEERHSANTSTAPSHSRPYEGVTVW